MTGMAYRKKMGWLLALAFGGTAAIALATGYFARSSDSGENFWLVFPALLVVGGLIFAVGAPWWNRLDDVQKQGQMSSWYWGGMAGAIVCVMWLVASGMRHSEFGMGAAAMFLSQAAGWALAWTVWRFRGRGQAE